MNDKLKDIFSLLADTASIKRDIQRLMVEAQRVKMSTGTNGFVALEDARASIMKFRGYLEALEVACYDEQN